MYIPVVKVTVQIGKENKLDLLLEMKGLDAIWMGIQMIVTSSGWAMMDILVYAFVIIHICNSSKMRINNFHHLLSYTTFYLVLHKACFIL